MEDLYEEDRDLDALTLFPNMKSFEIIECVIGETYKNSISIFIFCKFVW